jgi:hypothetical protein
VVKLWEVKVCHVHQEEGEAWQGSAAVEQQTMKILTAIQKSIEVSEVSDSAATVKYMIHI